jgi:hypothetical protein
VKAGSSGADHLRRFDRNTLTIASIPVIDFDGLKMDVIWPSDIQPRERQEATPQLRHVEMAFAAFAIFHRRNDVVAGMGSA